LTKRRDLNLKDEFGISQRRYRELYYFCQQYHEWHDELKFNTDSVKSPIITDMPHGGEMSDSTCNLAMRRVELSNRCKLVEQTAIEADVEIYQYILKNVANDGVGYTYLRHVMGIPCGKDKFYNARRKFFYLLDKKK